MAKKGVIEVGFIGILHGILHIYESALPPIYILLQKEFNVSSLELGLIGTVFSIAGVFQAGTGYLAVRVGRKRLTAMGMLIYTVSMFAFGLSPSFLVFLPLVALAGLGASTFHPATYSMISEAVPREHITKSMAYHQLGGFAGGAAGVALVGSLALYVGWRSALQLLVIPGLLVTAIFWFIVKEGKTTRDNEEKRTESETRFNITPPLMLIVLETTIAALGGGVARFLPMFLAVEYGESTAMAGILTGVMQGVGCVSLLIGGVVADRFDKVLLISIFSFLTGTSTIILASGHFSFELLVLILVARGFCQYFAGPARHALTALVSGRGPQGIGLEFAGTAVGSIFATPIAGFLIDLLGMRTAFFILTAFTFLAGANILLLKRWSSSYAVQEVSM